MTTKKAPMDRRKMLNLMIFFLAVVILLFAAVHKKLTLKHADPLPSADQAIAIFPETAKIESIEMSEFTIEVVDERIYAKPQGIVAQQEAEKIVKHWETAKGVLLTKAQEIPKDAHQIKLRFKGDEHDRVFHLYTVKRHLYLHDEELGKHYFIIDDINNPVEKMIN